MNSSSYIAGLLIIAGTILMGISILKFRGLHRYLGPLSAGQDSRIILLFRFRQILMAFFFLGYPVVFYSMVKRIAFISDLFVGIIFLLGAVFVFLGVTLEHRVLSQLNHAYRRSSDLNAALERERAHLLSSNERLNQEVMERKRAENALKKVQDELEQRVANRTAELEEKGRQLKDRIDETNRAKEMAEAASRAKSAFLANMSHELRTPLSHIIGFTELVIDRKCGTLNETQTDYLKDVLKSGRHLHSLIDDILDLSRVEAGGMEVELSAVNLKDMLEGSLKVFEEQAAGQQITLSYELKEVPDTIEADIGKLKQILHNLLSNAVKFTPGGGHISISARRTPPSDAEGTGTEEGPVEEAWGTPELIEISVADTGIGLAEKDLDHIFESFEQLDKSANRRFQGTGLGLALTRRLVELHGGRIWAESDGEGKGATFRFVIPLS